MTFVQFWRFSNKSTQQCPIWQILITFLISVKQHSKFIWRGYPFCQRLHSKNIHPFLNGTNYFFYYFVVVVLKQKFMPTYNRECVPMFMDKTLEPCLDIFILQKLKECLKSSVFFSNNWNIYLKEYFKLAFIKCRTL